jgi:hypothetical protein
MEPHPDTVPDLAAVKAAPVHDQADLERLWRALVGDPGFGVRSLWVLFLDEDGVAAPVIPQIDEIPVEPSAEGVAGLVGMLGDVRRQACPGASVALLLARPGRGIDETDRVWARALEAGAASAGLPLWPTHVATDLELRVVAPDDLAPAV